MGAFLFYLFKSTLCLLVFYGVFRLGFRGDTLFRTNRFLLLAGTMGCLLLPWVQVDVPQGNVWQKPLIVVETLLTDMPVEEPPVRGKGEVEPVLPSEAEACVGHTVWGRTQAWCMCRLYSMWVVQCWYRAFLCFHWCGCGNCCTVVRWENATVSVF